MEGMRPIADRAGLTMIQLACQWNLAHDGVRTVVPTLVQEAGPNARPVEDKRAELAALPTDQRLTAGDVETIREIGDNTGSMALKGANPAFEGDERPDAWAMSDQPQPGRSPLGHRPGARPRAVVARALRRAGEPARTGSADATSPVNSIGTSETSSITSRQRPAAGRAVQRAHRERPGRGDQVAHALGHRRQLRGVVAVGGAGDDVSECEGKGCALAEARSARTTRRPPSLGASSRPGVAGGTERRCTSTTADARATHAPLERRRRARPSIPTKLASESSNPACAADTPCVLTIVGSQLSVA